MPGSPTLNRARFRRAIERYLAYCYRRRTAARVSEFADVLGANRQHVSRTIASLFGMPLRRVLREYQLAYAEQILRTVPDLPIEEVALIAGFGHRSSFFRIYRRERGMTPGEYRAKSDKLRLDRERARR